MNAPHDRRGFLRGLAALPLIGGSVAILGKPTQAAVPVTGRMARSQTFYRDHKGPPDTGHADSLLYSEW